MKSLGTIIHREYLMIAVFILVVCLGVGNYGTVLAASAVSLPFTNSVSGQGVKLAATLAPSTSNASLPITVYVNDQLLTADVDPIINKGRTLVPLRAIFEALGASVSWDGSNQTVTAQKDDVTIILKIGSSVSTVNGQITELDVPSMVVMNRTMVPLRFVGEALGGRVSWDDSKRQVKIYSPARIGDKLVRVQVEENSVTLRSGPSAAANLLTTVSKDIQLDIIGEQDGWYHVNYMEQSGWVAGWLVKPIWQSPALADAKNLVLNYNKAADGLHLEMSASTKLQTKITESPGAITYNYSDCQLSQEINIQEKTSRGSLVITGSNQGSGVIVTVSLPETVKYKKDSDKNGLNQSLFIPNCIVAVEHMPFDSSGERLDITTLMPVIPTQAQNGNQIVVTFPGVAQGMAQSSYDYDSKSIKSLTIKQQINDNNINTLISIETRNAAELILGIGDKDRAVHLMLVLKSDIPACSSLVVLDPGHGGKDSGACGSFSKEKDVNLAVALKVGDLLSRKGIKVVYTRSTDVFIPLESEADTGNIMNAALFVAIHCNSVSDIPSAQGIETFYYAPESDPKLYMQKDDRRNLATAIQQRLIVGLGRPDRGVKTANELVLRETDMPSALVELGFLSNTQEEALLNLKSFQDKAAQAIAAGIISSMPGSTA